MDPFLEGNTVYVKVEVTDPNQFEGDFQQENIDFKEEIFDGEDLEGNIGEFIKDEDVEQADARCLEDSVIK